MIRVYAPRESMQRTPVYRQTAACWLRGATRRPANDRAGSRDSRLFALRDGDARWRVRVESYRNLIQDLKPTNFAGGLSDFAQENAREFTLAASYSRRAACAWISIKRTRRSHSRFAAAG